jgi:metal-responsive CopG/Arc/MetJ family transcriptional regulator
MYKTRMADIIKMYDTKNTYNRRVTTGFSLPHSLLNELDARREDVCRSKYVQRILEQYLKEMRLEKNGE